MRLLHTMLRVGNLQRSIDFYTGVLGMRLLRQKDYPDGKFTLAFVGYGDEADNTVIELTYNWDTDHYDLGTGYGHIAIEGHQLGSGRKSRSHSAHAMGGSIPGEDCGVGIVLHIDVIEQNASGGRFHNDVDADQVLWGVALVA